MAWYYYLAAVLFVILIAASAAMFLPLQIDMFYLRDNKNRQVVLTVKLYRAELKLNYFQNGESKASSFLNLGSLKIRLPVLGRDGRLKNSVVMEAYDILYGVSVFRRDISRVKLLFGLAAFKAIRPVLKKILWKRFELELTCGLDDPSLSGLVFGASWAVTGAILGLLQQCFIFKEAPRLKIAPRFDRAVIKVRWEGELVMPLFRGLKLLYLTIKNWRSVKWIIIPSKA